MDVKKSEKKIKGAGASASCASSGALATQLLDLTPPVAASFRVRVFTKREGPPLLRGPSPLFSSGLLHDQEGQAAENEHSGHRPQNKDRHGFLLRLPVSANLTRNSPSSASSQ
jgi:hypothetical protein